MERLFLTLMDGSLPLRLLAIFIQYVIMSYVKTLKTGAIVPLFTPYPCNHMMHSVVQLSLPCFTIMSKANNTFVRRGCSFRSFPENLIYLHDLPFHSM